MKRGLGTWGVWVGLLSLSGCVGKKDIAQLELRLDRLETQNAELQGRLARVDSLLRLHEEAAAMSRADLVARTSVLYDRLSVMEQKFDDQQQLLSRLAQRSEGASARAPLGTQAPADTGKVTKAQADPREIYNTAQVDLRRGNYDLALRGFQEYLKRVPRGEFSSHAQYWIGEVYYAKGDWARAIAEFQQVIDLYPQGAKVPSAMYKIAKTHLLLNQPDGARRYFQRVTAEYPTSPEAKLAEEDLKGLKP